MRHSLGYGSRVGICHSRHSFPHNGSWWLRNTGASRKLRGGGGDAIALKPPKADVPPVGQLKKLPYSCRDSILKCGSCR